MRVLIYNYIHDVYHKSKYIPTVTNFGSILANWLYFLQKITAPWPSVLNLRGRLVNVLDKPSKNGFVGRGLGRMLLSNAHILSAAWKLPLTRPRY